MSAVLVLGVSGFIGSHLAKKLLKSYDVVGFDMCTPEIKHHTNFTFIKGDFSESTDFVSIIKQYRISCIFHCISTTKPQQGTSHIPGEIRDNVLPTVNLLEAASLCGVERVVFLSSGGTVYGESETLIPHKEDEQLSPICSYGAQKVTIESYFQLYRRMKNLDAMIVRISNPYGVCRTSGRTQGIIPIFIQRLFSGEKIVLYGNTVRDYIYIDDVTDALCAIVEYKGSSFIFNIGSGKGVYLYDVVNEIETVAGQQFAEIEKCDIRSCDVGYSVLDISKAARELDWTPKTPLNTGIDMTIANLKRKVY